MRLGPHRVLLELGEGGMAHVYLAEARGMGSLERLVVLKCLKDHLAREPSMREAFRREAELGVRLRHPGIVQTYDLLEVEAQPIIVLEYVEGLTYGELAWNRAAPLPRPLHLAILRQLLRALGYLHDAEDAEGRPLDIVHRDVSPQNVLVTYEGAVKVLDFGIARSALDGGVVTAPGLFRGRLHYAAPERALGHPADRRADLFAVGIMLWEAWAGRRLWAGLHADEVRERLVSGRLPEFPEGRAPPPALRQLIDDALAVDPGRRWRSAAELVAALDELAAVGDLHIDSADELSAFLAEHYEGWRARRRQAIQQQLAAAALEDKPPSEPPPRLAEPLTPSGSEPAGERSAQAREEPPSLPPARTTSRRTPALMWGLRWGALALAGAVLTGTSARGIPRGAGTLGAGSVEGLAALSPAAPCPEPLVLADFEDGQPRPCSAPHRGGVTYFYADGTGTTTPKPGLMREATLLPVPRGTSRYAIHVTGKGLRDWGAGIAMLLDEKRPVDLSPYQGLTLWARAARPGTSIAIKLATPATLDESYGGRCRPRGALGCDDHYGGIREVSVSWTRYRIPFTDLRQGGWGMPAGWDAKAVVELHVSVIPSPSGSTHFDLWLDDIRLY